MLPCDLSPWDWDELSPEEKRELEEYWEEYYTRRGDRDREVRLGERVLSVPREP